MEITRIEPWLVRADSTGWGEYLFIEMRTDEGVTGWGEITTTTRPANRAIAGVVRALNDILVGEDPAQIERLMIETPLDNAGGSLRVPELPGLGVSMNMDDLRAHAVDGFGK